MMDGLLLVCLTGICASPDPLLLYERVAPQAERAESIVTSSEQPSSDRPAPTPRTHSTPASIALPVGATIQAPLPIDRETDQETSEGTLTSRAMSRATIAEIVRGQTDAIRRCYERGLSDDPSFKGTIEMGWKIDRSGHVTSTNIVAAAKRNEAAESCLRATIATWTFPVTAEPVVIGAYPFTFDAALLHHHAQTRARPASSSADRD